MGKLGSFKYFTFFLLVTSLKFNELNCQSELIFFSHIGHADQRILLDSEDERFFKEFRIGVAYNKDIIRYRKITFSLGGGYNFYHYLGKHHFVEKEMDNVVLVAFRTESLKYHNGMINLNAHYKINRKFKISLTSNSEFTGLIIPKLNRNRYIFDKFKYFGTALYLGFGYKIGKSVLTPQIRLLSLRPTDDRIFNEKYISLDKDYAKQIYKKINANNELQFGLTYAYQFNQDQN